MTMYQYSASHQYFLGNDQLGKVGVTPFAQEQLGDVVFVELPELGRVLKAGELVGCIESVKTASEYFSPLSGVVTAVNKAVLADSGLVNSAPLTDAWLYEMSLSAPSERASLMDEKTYLETL
ncbi:MAG: hypothetical protein RLZZ502_1075 [Pseudomonadota bacterium]|jgi:glycine cleavage system H protein